MKAGVGDVGERRSVMGCDRLQPPMQNALGVLALDVNGRPLPRRATQPVPPQDVGDAELFDEGRFPLPALSESRPTLSSGKRSSPFWLCETRFSREAILSDMNDVSSTTVLHRPFREQHAHLSRVVRGHCAYYLGEPVAAPRRPSRSACNALEVAAALVSDRYAVVAAVPSRR